MKTLFITNVGSHLWKMNRPDSDVDLYKVYIAPSENFLLGKMHMGGHEGKSGNTETVSFEVGHVIKQLKGGNLNHLLGVMSNIILETSSEHAELQKILSENIGKNCYHSIHGMSWHNYKRYFEDSPKTRLDELEYKKKLGQIGRVIKFGINLLRGGGFMFESYQPKSWWDIRKMLEELDESYKTSLLPEQSDGEVFDDFLLRLRLKHLGGK